MIRTIGRTLRRYTHLFCNSISTVLLESATIINTNNSNVCLSLAEQAILVYIIITDGSSSSNCLCKYLSGDDSKYYIQRHIDYAVLEFCNLFNQTFLIKLTVDSAISIYF